MQSMNTCVLFPQINASNLEPKRTKIQTCTSKPTNSNTEKIEFLPSHVKSITSTTNPFVKHCLKLRQSSSYRHSHGSVLVVGSTPISWATWFQRYLLVCHCKFNLLMRYIFSSRDGFFGRHLTVKSLRREIYSFQGVQERRTTLECLLVLDEAHIPEGLNLQSLRLVRISSMVMKKLSGLQSIDSIEMIALLKIPSTYHSVDDEYLEEDCGRWFKNAHRVLVLDGIQDPGNLGTLLRSATAFGWGGAFLLPGCCDPFNEKALRASRGASFQLPLVSGHWLHLDALRNHFNMKLLAGHPASDERLRIISRLSRDFADSLADLPLCLILGSEGGGLSEKAKHASELVSIPMAGEFESLNVSVAGGIFLYMLQPENRKA